MQKSRAVEYLKSLTFTHWTASIYLASKLIITLPLPAFETQFLPLRPISVASFMINLCFAKATCALSSRHPFLVSFCFGWGAAHRYVRLLVLRMYRLSPPLANPKLCRAIHNEYEQADWRYMLLTSQHRRTLSLLWGLSPHSTVFSQWRWCRPHWGCKLSVSFEYKLSYLHHHAAAENSEQKIQNRPKYPCSELTSCTHRCLFQPAKAMPCERRMCSNM